MNTKFFISVACAILSVGLIGCSDSKNVAGDWTLCFFDDGNRENIENFSLVTISLDNVEESKWQFKGFSGVNDFSGFLTVDKEKILVDKKIATTRMAGPADKMEFEKKFLQFLSNADLLKVAKASGLPSLEIKNSKNGQIARFKKFSLAETKWLLTSQSDGSAVVSLEDGVNISLDFLDKKQSHAFTGLNHLNVPYKTEASNRSLCFNMTSGSTTLVSGSNKEMEIESLFIKNLSDVSSYLLKGNELSLCANDGNIKLIFIQQDLVK